MKKDYETTEEKIERSIGEFKGVVIGMMNLYLTLLKFNMGL